VSFFGERLYFLTGLVLLQYWQSATAPKLNRGSLDSAATREEQDKVIHSENSVM